jgi:hypothetical protein
MNTTNILHWILIASGVAISIATAVMGSPDVKLAGYAATVLSIAQVIHKFADANENKATVVAAVSATVPIAKAAATGNTQQVIAVEQAVHKA